MKKKLIFFNLLLCVLSAMQARAQQIVELNTGWKCRQADEIKLSAGLLSQSNYKTSDWMPALVPGTVLGSLLLNHKIPDPFYGMNNKAIPDIYSTGNAYYTYWFVNDFTKKPLPGRQVFLNFRGINYSCDIYLNGKKVNTHPSEGMFLRQSYNITPFLNADGHNRLAVLVHPAPFSGDPNGGQGGDGTIARNVGMQYTAGWDWIQPMHDRNTGIWDKVTLQETGTVRINNPHVITLVPGTRQPDGPQQPAIIQASAELENTSAVSVKGNLQYTIGGKTVAKAVTLAAHAVTEISLNDLSLPNPRLWWPNGYGAQNLYVSEFKFTTGTQLSDKQTVSTGIRQITTSWNDNTHSRQFMVNGQRIFIKGGNWILSDAMLRFSNARYDAEVRYHRDMNLNLIRVWGGGMIERPEFYAACDKYGLLVFQDFWMSGDCNGRWADPKKKDDQATRRQYPDDHNLFLASAADQVKMVRNYASLAIWCGGNEITPPEDILAPLRDSILPKLDGTRHFFDFSNSADMSNSPAGTNGDGPYTIQNSETFWKDRTFGFNSEEGSVGVGDYESLLRFIPEKDLTVPKPEGRAETADSVWDYHKYGDVGYRNSLEPYGTPENIRDFAFKAQLVNYDQYRALMEGFSAHMWDWYTGIIIWKTQNPWTAMRGQMYDYYLDPNACLYGLRSGSEPVHIMYNPVNGAVTGVNNTYKPKSNLRLQIKAYDMAGKEYQLNQTYVSLVPSAIENFASIKRQVDRLRGKQGIFLSLQLTGTDQKSVSNNFYWLPDTTGKYSGLRSIKKAELKVSAQQKSAGKVTVTLSNPAGGPVAFFNRVSLIDKQSGLRILPAFADDNYLSVMPGETRTVIIDYNSSAQTTPAISVRGWNVDEQTIPIN